MLRLMSLFLERVVDNNPPRVNNTYRPSLWKHMLTAHCMRSQIYHKSSAASIITRRVAEITHRPLLYVTIVQSVAMAISGSNCFVLICGEMKEVQKYS